MMNGATHHQNRVVSNHTIRSHGAKIVRAHLYDWLVFVLLVVLEGVLQLIHPFNRFVSSTMMGDLKYPLKSNTIPIWSVPLYAVVLPMIIFTLYYFRKRNVYDLHNSILGILYAVAITAVITDTVKISVGRLRPNFFWRCFPDGNEKYDDIGNAICDGVKSVIIEGRKSFPSGHSSMSFAGLTFLSLYLCGKMRVFDHKGHVSKLCIVIVPLLAATLVAVSRVDDYWHHWQDVLTGGLLGILVAFFCYRQFFPSPNDLRGFEPYACLATMEDEAIHIYVDQERAHVTYDPEMIESNDPEAQKDHQDR